MFNNFFRFPSSWWIDNSKGGYRRGEKHEFLLMMMMKAAAAAATASAGVSRGHLRNSQFPSHSNFVTKWCFAKKSAMHVPSSKFLRRRLSAGGGGIPKFTFWEIHPTRCSDVSACIYFERLPHSTIHKILFLSRLIR